MASLNKAFNKMKTASVVSYAHVYSCFFLFCSPDQESTASLLTLKKCLQQQPWTDTQHCKNAQGQTTSPNEIKTNILK